jgi:hypothetical protein
MKTECNCDMPLWAYHDWLIEEGWEGGAEEIEGFCPHSYFYGGKSWKERGTPYEEDHIYNEGYNISIIHDILKVILIDRDDPSHILWCYDYHRDSQL